MTSKTSRGDYGKKLQIYVGSCKPTFIKKIKYEKATIT